jgi:TolB protein
MFKKINVILLLSFWLTSNSWAVLTIEITQGQDEGAPIAVVPFSWAGKGTPPEAIHEIIAADLQRSGFFSPLPVNDMLTRPDSAQQVNMKNWRAVNVDAVVVGNISSLPDGTFQVRFQLLDVHKGTQLAGYNIRSRKPDLRRTAHQISDIIYKKITGKPGAFDTHIAYVTVSVNRKKQKIFRLAVADSDGFNERIVFESNKPIMSPNWSPDGKRLVYVSFKNNRPEIYMQNILSGERKNIASFKGINSAPVFSPNGKRLALTLSKDGNPEIYILELKTNKFRRITRSRAIDTEPTWMPDGNAIVFTSDRGGSPQLYTIKVSSTGPVGRSKRLTFDGKWNARAAVSPDGRYLALVHREEGNYQIAVQDLNSGHFRILTDSRLDESPSFSPNGSMIIYATEDNYRGVLSAVSVDGRSHQRLMLKSGDVREPAWSSYKQN